MRIRRVVMAGAILVLMAGCATVPKPSADPTPSPSVETTAPATDPTAEAGPIVGFELSATELVAVDDERREVEVFPLSDGTAVVEALVDFQGAPEVLGDDESGCPYDFTSWSGTELLVAVSRDTSAATVFVKRGGLGIEPSSGPRFGEQVADFVATLDPSLVAHDAYLYERVPGATTNFGAMARFDEGGAVVGIFSPWPLGAFELC